MPAAASDAAAAPAFDPVAAAQALDRARREGRRVASTLLRVRSRSEAYAVQDAGLAALGPIGGWKLGTGADGQPLCAPLPAAGLHRDAAVLRGAGWHLRGIELEVCFRLGADLPPRAAPYTGDEAVAAVDAVLPANEVAETRLSDWLDAGCDAQLADLLCHGGLVLGPARPFEPAWLDLRAVEAEVRFDGQLVARTAAEHPASDARGLLAWLANHCAARGAGLRAGQVVATGSCTGMLFASEGTHVRAELFGLAPLEAFF